jgi:hypothetical protein
MKYLVWWWDRVSASENVVRGLFMESLGGDFDIYSRLDGRQEGYINS